MPSGGPPQTECNTSWSSRPRSDAVSPASAASQPCAPRRAVAKALNGHCDCAVRTLDPPAAWPAGKGTQLKSSTVTVCGSGTAGAESSAGKSCGGPANFFNQPRRTRVDAVALFRVAEVNLGRGSEQPARHGGGQIPIELWRCVRHSRFTLHIERKQGMRSATARPRVFVRAQEPDGIGRKSGRLGRAGNQNGRILRFGSKERRRSPRDRRPP